MNTSSSATPSRPASLFAGLTLADAAGLLAGPLLIFAITIINGHGRIFWEDEVLGWALLRDPSWHHMLRAWKLGADGGGILFYILGRLWFFLFGDGVLAFRLFTATTFSLGFEVLWLGLRRFYPAGIVAFATFNTLFFSPPLTMHYMEGRFYGLLVLNTALAFLLVLQLDRVPDPVPGRWYTLTFLVHLLLTASHVLGVVYSFFLVLALIALDLFRGRRRPLLYLAAGLSWLLLLAEFPAIAATARVGKPHFWTQAPTLGQVLGAYSVFSPEILIVLLLLLLGFAASLPRSSQALRRLLRTNLQARLPVYLGAGCLLLVPVAFLLEGLVGTWLFTDRYLQPVALGIACLTAELLEGTRRLVPAPDLPRSRWPATALLARSGFAAAFASLLLFWVFRHEAQYTPSVPDFTPALTSRLPGGLPIVVEDAFTFSELMSRPAGHQRPYTFLLDWNYALSHRAPRMEVTQYHLMENWRTAGYFADRIQDRAAFLSTTPAFLVVSNSILGPHPEDRPEVGNPLAADLARQPGYTAQPLLTLDRIFHDNQRDTVWLICRQRCPASVAVPAGAPQHCILSSTLYCVPAPSPQAQIAR